MKTQGSRMFPIAALAFALGVGLAASSALAAEIKRVGTITEIQMAADGQSAIAILEDGKSGQTFKVTITDSLTLDKFKDERIVEGDEIRVKYDDAGGVNKSLSFKKTAGC